MPDALPALGIVAYVAVAVVFLVMAAGEIARTGEGRWGPAIVGALFWPLALVVVVVAVLVTRRRDD